MEINVSDSFKDQVAGEYVIRSQVYEDPELTAKELMMKMQGWDKPSNEYFGMTWDEVMAQSKRGESENAYFLDIYEDEMGRRDRGEHEPEWNYDDEPPKPMKTKAQDMAEAEAKKNKDLGLDEDIDSKREDLEAPEQKGGEAGPDISDDDLDSIVDRYKHNLNDTDDRISFTDDDASKAMKEYNEAIVGTGGIPIPPDLIKT
jgi:hypothetical protein